MHFQLASTLPPHTLFSNFLAVNSAGLRSPLPDWVASHLNVKQEIFCKVIMVKVDIDAFNVAKDWLLKAYPCMSLIFGKDGGNRGHEREIWEPGAVGWLLALFEDPGISALVGSARHKVSSCLSRRGADSSVIVFRPPVSCLSSTYLCVGTKSLLELKKSFNRNFFFSQDCSRNTWPQLKISTKLM